MTQTIPCAPADLPAHADGDAAPQAGAQDLPSLALPSALAAASALLAACGGGGAAPAPSPAPAPAPSPAPAPAPAPSPAPAPAPSPAPAPAPPNAQQAARFLAQATLGAPRAEIESVRTLGYEGWLDKQFTLPGTQSHFDWLTDHGYAEESYRNSTAGLDNTLWRKFIASPDLLRQRMTLALSELLVVSILGVGGPFRQFAVANYVDILEANAFGNYRALLGEVTLSTAMGYYLTYRGNAKASTSGSQPDENYARELMQLFTIGLVKLNADGTVAPGAPETYGPADVSGLARVFTGWDLDVSGLANPPPATVHRRPMAQVASRYETGAKSFLGTTISAGIAARPALDAALDVLFLHPNLPPFVSRQLIQRLVSSNPTPGYVGRVAAVFADNGQGVRGDLRAVLRAILLDAEARDATVAAHPAFGKLREPVERFLNWARAFNAASPAGLWNIGDLSDAGTRLGQSPLRSPSVFNFFRPGYVPPTSALAAAGLQAPELQITTESSVAGYVNFMQNAIAGSSIGEVRADYAPLLALASNTQALLDEINLVLAAGQVAPAALAVMKNALDTISAGTDAGKRNRVNAALLLVLASPDYIVQK